MANRTARGYGEVEPDVTVLGNDPVLYLSSYSSLYNPTPVGLAYILSTRYPEF